MSAIILFFANTINSKLMPGSNNNDIFLRVYRNGRLFFCALKSKYEKRL
nr:MAG TPA_asm: hypothetical protein [Caudoviricetes sp.]